MMPGITPGMRRLANPALVFASLCCSGAWIWLVLSIGEPPRRVLIEAGPPFLLAMMIAAISFQAAVEPVTRDRLKKIASRPLLPGAWYAITIASLLPTLFADRGDALTIQGFLVGTSAVSSAVTALLGARGTLSDAKDRRLDDTEEAS